MKDSLGNRMKRYENVNRHFLTPKLPVILRLDGKAFHTFTKGCSKPFDGPLGYSLERAAAALVENIQGAEFAYQQSDEVSLLVTDFSSLDAELWFGGNVQKITSVAASMFTAHFNANYKKYQQDMPFAYFDCRVFQLPNNVEVVNYFRWRNQDCYRNAVSAIAQTLFSHKELQGASTNQLIFMIEQKCGKKLSELFDDIWLRGAFISGKDLKVVEAWNFVNDGGKLAAMVPEIDYGKK